ncbi:KTSC domain-containing protein [Sinorhizobium americanum]|uniref:KTSC domain-containing protein n=1 Tax=Sinorhizobium americanum TaxID=194963 RepID=A0A4R2BVS1_9HYPH|nr:KTSC domain-containing protein [Sinorhizobium americanum]TCN31948.1 KTSC domain-containing protein [Sinorhizobium americanum]
MRDVSVERRGFPDSDQEDVDAEPEIACHPRFNGNPTVKYDPPRRTLSIWFVGNHRPYHYLGVPMHVYEELLQADSAGGYFNHRLRDHCDFLH